MQTLFGKHSADAEYRLVSSPLLFSPPFFFPFLGYIAHHEIDPAEAVNLDPIDRMCQLVFFFPPPLRACQHPRRCNKKSATRLDKLIFLFSPVPPPLPFQWAIPRIPAVLALRGGYQPSFLLSFFCLRSPRRGKGERKTLPPLFPFLPAPCSGCNVPPPTFPRPNVIAQIIGFFFLLPFLPVLFFRRACRLESPVPVRLEQPKR